MNMKKQKLLFFPFLFALGISLFSCNVGNNGNVTTYQNTPAVATYNSTVGGYVLGTPYGYYAAPELTTLFEGECLFLQQFSIDYDNQLSTQYTTLSNVLAVSVNQSSVEIGQDSTVNIQNFNLPLSNVSGLSSAYYQGKFFIGATTTDGNPSFRLVYNSTNDAADGTKNLYLLAAPSSSGTSSAGTNSIYAFDLSYLVQSMGRDTTIAVSGTTSTVNLKYIMANLNYLSGISDAGVPTYSGVTQQNPFAIYIFQ